jgi:hypothetical protein
MEIHIPRSLRSALCLLLVGLLGLFSAAPATSSPGTAFARSTVVPLPGAGSWDIRFDQTLGLRLDGYSVTAFAVNARGEMFVAGSFTWAGTTAAAGIAKWNGATWQPLAQTVKGQIEALAVSGDVLYAGGRFKSIDGVAADNIAKWDGTRWSAVGGGVSEPDDYDQVRAIAVRGNEVYVGGTFSAAGGVSANNIAKWNGSAWSALQAAGSSVNGVNSNVYALAVSGSLLYVGGSGFTQAGAISANNIAQWNGSAWSALGDGVSYGAPGQGYVLSMAVSGGELYVVGSFSQADGVPVRNVAKWNGSAWSGFSGDLPYWGVTSVAVVGSSVYISAVGNNTISNTFDILRWDGSQWVVFTAGNSGRLAAYGDSLYVGGSFHQIGGTAANGIARWDGSRWHSFGRGVGQHGTVTHMAAYRNDVYIAGRFHQAGQVQTMEQAHWNGTGWSALGRKRQAYTNLMAVTESGVYSIARVRTGGGDGAAVVKWDGREWMIVTSMLSSEYDMPDIYALLVDGTNIYVGGAFVWAGSIRTQSIAMWNGSTWSALGDGIHGVVSDMALSGGNLYVGGRFERAGDVTAHNIARWDGTRWSALGSGVSAQVTAVAATDNTLYVGGTFWRAGDQKVRQIAKWDGSQWSSLGVGVAPDPDDWTILGVYDIAVAPISGRVYVGGRFTHVINGTTEHPTEIAASNIAVWDGKHWSALGSGLNNRVNAVVTTQNHVYVGGDFTQADGHSAYGLARWTEPVVTFLPLATSAAR